MSPCRCRLSHRARRRNGAAPGRGDMSVSQRRLLSALTLSATSLVPIVDLGLRARMLSADGDVCREEPIHLSHSQLRAR